MPYAVVRWKPSANNRRASRQHRRQLLANGQRLKLGGSRLRQQTWTTTSEAGARSKRTLAANKRAGADVSLLGTAGAAMSLGGLLRDQRRPA